jgi:hypothetical protein
MSIGPSFSCITRQSPLGRDLKTGAQAAAHHVHRCVTLVDHAMTTSGQVPCFAVVRTRAAAGNSTSPPAPVARCQDPKLALVAPLGCLMPHKPGVLYCPLSYPPPPPPPPRPRPPPPCLCPHTPLCSVHVAPCQITLVAQAACLLAQLTK